jgi:ABC-2 type transport system permease protein
MKASKFRKYYEFTEMGLKEAAAYKFNAFMALGTSLLYLLLFYYIWSAIDASGTIEGGLAQVLTYLVIGQVVSNAAFIEVESFFGEKIRKGTIVNELKRPVSLRLQVYSQEAGGAFFDLIARGLPVLVAGLLFFNVTMPTLSQLGIFLISLFLSFNLVFLFSYMTSMLIFWTKIGWSVRMMRTTVQGLFSGVLFPLYLLPPDLKIVFDLLPFQSMADGPISIFLMQRTGVDAFMVLGKQLIWIVILAFLGELAWRKARKKLTVQGG